MMFPLSGSRPLRAPVALLLLSLALSASGASAVKVVKDGQGVYARSNENSKFATLPAGTVLAVREKTSDGWVKVAAPPTIGCWAYAETVKDGRVSSRICRLRTAPNPGGSVIASMQNGDKLVVVGKEGEWYKVIPPSTASLWVRQDSVVDTAEAPTKAPVVTSDPSATRKPDPPRPEPPKVEPPKPEPPKVEPPKPEPPKVEPPKPEAPKAEPSPPPPPPQPKYADSSTLAPKWVPPADEPAPQPPVLPPKPPRDAPKDVSNPAAPPSSAPVALPPPANPQTPPPPKTTPPPKTVAPALASGATVAWPVQPATAVSAPPRPAGVPATAPAPAPSSSSDWESFDDSPAPPAAPQSFAAGTTRLPRRPFAQELKAPSPGTLLRRKDKTDRNRVAAVPKGISAERLRTDVYQGDRGCAHGVLVKDDGGIRMRPSPYELCILQGDGKKELVAYVLGTDAQLGPYVGATVQVEGTCWWLGDSAAAIAPTAPIQRLH